MSNHLHYYEKALEVAAGETRAWLTMKYGCDACGWEHDVWTAYGVEGPKPLRDLPDGGMIPAPFYCGSCPKCGGALMHVRWREDVELDELTTIPEQVARFVLPTMEQAREYAAKGYGGAHYIDPSGQTRRPRNRAQRRGRR